VKLCVTSAKVTGTPGESGWTQVHDFTPEDKKKIEKRGRLFAVISTKGTKEGLGGVESGREILARLHEEYFGNLEKSAFNGLTEAVEKVLNEYKSEGGSGVEIAAAAFVGGVLYSVCGNKARAYLFRNASLVKILVSKPNEVVSASGYPKKGDAFLLGTKALFECLPNGIIKASLATGSLERSAEAFTAKIHSEKGTGNLGLVLISFNEEVAISSVPQKKEVVSTDTKPKQGIIDKLRKSTVGAIDKTLAALPTKRIYVKKGMDDLESTKNKKTFFTVGAILLILLLVSIGFGIKQSKDKQKKAQYEERLTQATHLFEESQSLVSLNSSRSRELFGEARQIIDEMIEEGIEDEEVNNLKKQLEEKEGELLGEYRQDPELYVDLSLFRDGFAGDMMVGTSDRLYVFDANSKKIISVGYENKNTKLTAGPDQLDNAKKIAAYSNRVYTLESDGIYIVGDDRERVIDESFNTDDILYAYAGNLYLIKKSDSDIVRYPGITDGFAEGKSWFAPGIEINLSGVVGVSIDGSIWIVTESGKVEKLTQGSPDSLTSLNVHPKPTEDLLIYASEDNQDVYLLDPTNSRIAVMDKKGEYKASYVSDKLKEAKGLVATEDNKKIIFLGNEGRLYSFEIKHL